MGRATIPVLRRPEPAPTRKVAPMNLKKQVLELLKGHGMAGLFAVRQILQAVVPALPEFVNQFGKLLDYLLITCTEQLEREQTKLTPENAAYLGDLQQALEILLTPMRTIRA